MAISKISKWSQNLRETAAKRWCHLKLEKVGCEDFRRVCTRSHDLYDDGSIFTDRRCDRVADLSIYFLERIAFELLVLLSVWENDIRH